MMLETGCMNNKPRDMRRERGGYNVQSTNKKDTRQKTLLGFGNRQIPDHLQRQNQDADVRQDIGDLLAIVEFGRVNARALDLLVPELVDGDAHQRVGDDDADGPQNDKSREEVYGPDDVAHGEEPLVQSQDGQLDEGHAAGVDEGVGPSDLRGELA